MSVACGSLVAYCTSDSWAGWRWQPAPGVPFRFLGAAVVRHVVAELVPALRSARSLLLAGSSAGAAGVLLNVDAVAAQLRESGLRGVRVRGVADSGWLLERGRRATEAAKRAHALWLGRPPAACRRRHAARPWRCYFATRLYPALSAPVFVFQWLFDGGARPPRPPVTRAHWQKVHRAGDALRRSLLNVTAVFAPSCVAHSVLTRADWASVRVGGLTLPRALSCWEKLATPAPPAAKIRNSTSTSTHRWTEPTEMERSLPSNGTHPRRRGKKHPRGRRRGQGRGRGRGRGRARREAYEGDPDSEDLAEGACPLRSVERCSWPQCNPSCPRLLHPLTGREMDFLELLAAFGLDVAGAAHALGLDLPTLRSMDRAQLLRLLTQRAN